MVRPRRTATRLCRCGASAPLFSSTRRTHAQSGSSFLFSSGNPQTVQSSNFQTILRSIPFRITSFADPHPLTLIESNLYKKQGWGWAPQHLARTQALSTCATRGNTRNPNTFMCLLHGSLDTRGWGACCSSARLRVRCVSALSFSFLRFSTSGEPGRAS
jgi:hypothetical protein